MESTLDNTLVRPRADTNTWSWIWQAVTGLGIIFLVGLHMIAHHFVVQGGLRNFEQVQAYIRNPLILILEVLFLITVTAHALLGVRAILFDLGLSDRAERAVSQGLTVLGVLTVGYGLWLTWVVIR